MIFIENDLRIVNLGTDFSGVIKHLGGEEDVSSDFKIGDKVYGQASILNGGSGAFAELAHQIVRCLFFWCVCSCGYPSWSLQLDIFYLLLRKSVLDMTA